MFASKTCSPIRVTFCGDGGIFMYVVDAFQGAL